MEPLMTCDVSSRMMQTSTNEAEERERETGTRALDLPLSVCSFISKAAGSHMIHILIGCPGSG